MFDPSPPPDLFSPVPAAASCPRSLDCALQRREFCPPGSGACGPCLASYQEDDRGRCVQKQLSPSGMCTHPAAASSATPSQQTCPTPLQLQEVPCLEAAPRPCSTLAPHPLASPLRGSRIPTGTVALFRLTPSCGSPQLWSAFGTGGEHVDLTALLVHPPAPVTVCAAAPCQHPGVPEPGTGGCLGGCWGALESIWLLWGGGFFTGEDMAAQTPRCCRSRTQNHDPCRPRGRGK